MLEPEAPLAAREGGVGDPAILFWAAVGGCGLELWLWGSVQRGGWAKGARPPEKEWFEVRGMGREVAEGLEAMVGGLWLWIVWFVSLWFSVQVCLGW
jgi:hypothetical protein